MAELSPLKKFLNEKFKISKPVEDSDLLIACKFNIIVIIVKYEDGSISHSITLSGAMRLTRCFDESEVLRMLQAICP